MDDQTGDLLRRREPQSFVNRFAKNNPPRNIPWLMRSCYTLMPDQPLTIDQKLFEKERTDYHIAVEQLQEGNSYTVLLQRPRGVQEGLKGTLTDHIWSRIFTGHWFSDIQWEGWRGYTFYQTKSGAFTVVKS